MKEHPIERHCDKINFKRVCELTLISTSKERFLQRLNLKTGRRAIHINPINQDSHDITCVTCDQSSGLNSIVIC